MIGRRCDGAQMGDGAGVSAGSPWPAPGNLGGGATRQVAHRPMMVSIVCVTAQGGMQKFASGNLEHCLALMLAVKKKLYSYLCKHGVGSEHATSEVTTGCFQDQGLGYSKLWFHVALVPGGSTRIPLTPSAASWIEYMKPAPHAVCPVWARHP